MKLLTPSAAGQLLRDGGVVAIPTETVYGLAGRADSAAAVQKIFEAKGRPANDPLIVHLADLEQLPLVASDIPHQAWELAGRFWPGPLTLVLPKQPAIPDSVTSGLATVAVRIPSHPIARDIIRSCGFPLAAPSANLFGRTSPTQLSHLAPELTEAIDGVVDGGPSTVGVESTIVALLPGKPPAVLRPGGISVEELQEVVGPLQLPASATEATSQQPLLAPGTLPSHYAPRTPLYLDASLSPQLRQQLQQLPVARLIYGNPQQSEQQQWNAVAERYLSLDSSTEEAARNLYKMVMELDSCGAGAIVADLLPEVGLGRAVNDRLRRAAHR